MIRILCFLCSAACALGWDLVPVMAGDRRNRDYRSIKH
jgi:hypothetical protein